VAQEGGSADAVVVGEAWAQAQVLADCERAQELALHAGEQPVDLAQRDPGVGGCRRRHVGDHLERVEPGCAADEIGRHADNCGTAA